MKKQSLSIVCTFYCVKSLHNLLCLKVFCTDMCPNTVVRKQNKTKQKTSEQKQVPGCWKITGKKDIAIVINTKKQRNWNKFIWVFDPSEQIIDIGLVFMIFYDWMT